MDIVSHALIGRIIAFPENKKKVILWIMFFGILPDLVLLPFYVILGAQHHRPLFFPQNSDWISADAGHPILASFYDFSHSLLFAFLIVFPLVYYFRLSAFCFTSYLSHLVIDIPTHSGEWSIKMFYPFGYDVNGFTNAWSWPLKYMALTWLILLAVIFSLSYLKRKKFKFF